MTDIASLGIKVDSSQVQAAGEGLDRLSTSGKKTEESLKGATRETEKLSGATRTLASAARQAAAVIGIGFGVSQIVSMIDQYTKLTAQVRLASTSAGDFARSMDAINRISRTAQSGLAQTAMLYARISNAARGFGLESSKVAAITETVALALKVSGASAAESASAILQLSQAFGSGVLRGEEFNAVNEAGPRIMQALADGMGITRGQLRGLSQDGKITTETMARVFSSPKLLAELREQAAQIQTLSGSFTVLSNSVMQMVGVQAQASGTVNVLTRGIQLLADNLDVVLVLIATLMAAKLASWAVGVAAAMQQAAFGVGALSAAMTFLAAHPIVALITAIGLATAAWMAFGRESKTANNAAKESVIESTDAMIKALDKQIEKHQQVIALRNEGQTLEQANKNQPYIAQIDLLGKEIALINDLKGEYAGLDRVKQDKARAEVLARIVELTAKQREEEESNAKATAITQGEARLKFMEDYATKNEKMIAKIAEARKALGAAFTADDEARIRKAFEETDKGATAAAAAAKKQASEYATLTAQIRTQTEEYKTAVAVGNDLTDAQKIRIKLDQDMAAGRSLLTEAQRTGIETDLQALDVAQKAMIAAEDAAKAYTERLNAMQGAAEAASKEADQQEQLAATFGMTKTAIAELEVARLMEQRAQKISINTTTPAEIAAMDELIAAKKRSAKAISLIDYKTLGEEAAKKAADEWKKASDDINKSLTDALLRGFESGKGFAKNLRDTVVNMFKTLVLRPIISAVLSPVTGALAIGGGVGAAAAGDVSGNLGVASTLYNTYKAITSGFSGLSAGVTAAVDKVSLMMMNSSNSIINGVGTSIFNASPAVGTAAGVAAGAAAGITLGNMISGQYGSPLTTVAGTAIGAVVGSVVPVLGTALGAAIGGVLGGVVNRLFGMGKKKVTSQGIVGTFEDDSFEGQSFTTWKQKGGLFRKSKKGTDYDPLDAETTEMLTEAFLHIKAASMIAASSLGLTADAIENYSKDIKVTLTKDAEKNKEALTAMLTGVADDMASKVAPGIEAFAKEGETASGTLSRLSGGLIAANALMGTLGHSLFDISLEGANSASLLIDAFGGLEKMTAALSGYFDNFYTGAEKRAATISDITAALNVAGLNISDDYIGKSTRENFRALVAAQDLTTESGRQAYTALINVSEAFASITQTTDELNAQIGEWQNRLDVLTGATTQQAIDRAAELSSAATGTAADLMQLVFGLEDLGAAVTAANDAVYAAQSGLEESYQAEASALQEIIDAGAAAAQELAQAQTDLVAGYEAEATAMNGVIGQFENFRVSLLKFRDSLLVGGLTTRSPEEQYRAQQALFSSTAAAAAAGDVTALGNLQEVAQNFLTASQDYNASTAAYVADFNTVQAALTAAADAAGEQVDLVQGQLDATVAVQAAIETAATVAHNAALAQAVADGQAAQAQLDALTASVDGLITINESVLSVADAIAVLQAALTAQSQATEALSTATTAAAAYTPPTAAQATVTAAYAAVGRVGFGDAGNQIDQAGYDYWIQQLTTGAISSSGFQDAFLGAVASYVGDPRYQPSVDIARALLAAGTDLPGFANGGMASGWAMVGERGPELVNFTAPSRVYTAPETRAALSGDESAPLLRLVLTELRALVRQNGAVGTATVDRLDKVATKLDAQRREISRAA